MGAHRVAITAAPPPHNNNIIAVLIVVGGGVSSSVSFANVCRPVVARPECVVLVVTLFTVACEIVSRRREPHSQVVTSY